MDKPTIINTAEIVPKQAFVDVKNNKAAKIKVIAISVAAVCITVAIVAGFVFTFKVHAETTVNIVISQIENIPFNETVEEDLDDRTKLYTVYHAKTTQYILYDFNRKLKLVKTEHENRCLVTAMDLTEKDVEDMHDNNKQAPSVYNVDREPVHDKSFLSKRGQELCKDDHVYWAMISTGPDTGMMTYNGSEDHHRGKRSHVLGHTQCCGPCDLICSEICNGIGVCYIYNSPNCYIRLDVYRYCTSLGHCHCYYYTTEHDRCCECECSLHPVYTPLPDDELSTA